ncbi:MAG: carbohydrate-binding protein [Lachnospiraceae bacterium]|jgi:hypothetical protein|nr:carbohydrate-binding protein [Lachnospiraceae bacterium]
MKKGTSRLLAGILAAVLAFEAGAFTGHAKPLSSSILYDEETTVSQPADTTAAQEESAAPVQTESTTAVQEESTTAAQKESTTASQEESTTASQGEGTTASQPESTTVPQTGQETGSQPGEAADTQPEETTASDTAGTPYTTEGRETVSINGGIELAIVSGMRLLGNAKFNVTLSGPESQSGEIELTPAEGLAASQGTVRFDNLAPGEYLLSVSADGYVNYAQTVRVEQYHCKLQLYTGRAEGFDGAHPGMLIAGDFTGDDKLDADDRDRLIDTIQSGKYDPVFDLNKDQKVDLMDLQYFTRYFGVDDAGRDSTVELQIPKDAVRTAQSKDTKVEGDLSSLLTNEGTVTLSPADGGTISTSSPVSLGFDFADSREGLLMDGLVIQSPAGSENTISQATIMVSYLDENGNEQAVEVPAARYQAGRAALMASKMSGSATIEADGTITVRLGQKVAVKRVIFTITGTTNGNLAEISRVEFLNDMESRIPEPARDIPEGLTAEGGNKLISLTWQKARNVTSYEVSITYGGVTETHRTTATSMKITQFQNDKLKNNEEYIVCVQSVNGDWRSGYSDPVRVVPKTDKVPDAPAGVQAEGAFQSIRVSWKADEDADTCNLYYKADGEESFQKIEGIEGTSYVIRGLLDCTKYVIYVTGVNEIGEGAASETVAAVTVGTDPVQLPQYRIITEVTEEGKLLSHVKSAVRGRGSMNGSPLDEGNQNTALGTVDGNFSSYFYIADWDEGVFYDNGKKGVTVELDQEYTMDRFVFAAPDNTYRYSTAAVYYWDAAQNKEVRADGVSLSEKKDSQGRYYYVIKLTAPVTTSRVRLGFSRYVREIAVSELRFYEYDSLEADIMALYGDALHLTLRSDVTQEELDGLRARLEEKHNDEYHPDKEILERELNAAQDLFDNQSSLDDIITVHTGINSAADSQLAVGGLNGWQPIGVSASAGEEIVIYVGHDTKKSGENSDLYLVASQYHAEGSAVAKDVVRLKIGRNVVTIPGMISNDREKGGSLYVEYRGRNASEQYAVRSSGGTKIPVLDLYQVADEQERADRINRYVAELNAFVDNLEQAHTEAAHEYAYDAQQCTANVTEIMLNYMLLSLPASQVRDALKSGDMAAQLDASAKAMDGMLTLFYQHKGLTDSFAEGTAESIVTANRLPARHLNIRYMKMNGGAFMYAAGNHIGIQWPETRGMVTGKTPQVDENGKLISGTYFGWGIAHEIGHDINQGAYAFAEVTNNYFSMLAKSDDTNGSTRYRYADVYEKVTSGTVGHANNVFVQLAMYWQLHLAYDNGYNFRLYDNYDEIFDNLFFARVDSYARDSSGAPKPGGVALTLDGGSDQNLMRLASAAAEKDLSEFFIRWGLIPNQATKAYMSQFEPEERAIYYMCEDARAYRIEKGGVSGADGTIDKKDVVNAAVHAQDSEVTLTMTGKTEVVLGFEITRVTIAQGKEQREVVGFTTTDTYVDSVGHLGNRAVYYEVAAVDQYMNRSAAFVTEAVKLSGDGILEKTGWTIETNMKSDQDVQVEGGEDTSCMPTTEPAASMMIDGKKDETYTGVSDAGEDPYIVLALNRSERICGLRYTAGSGDGRIDAYRIEISRDGQNFETVKEGSFTEDGTFVSESDGSVRIYFTNQDMGDGADKDPRIAIYDAVSVRITAAGMAGREVSVTEMDLIAPSGDNVEFYRTTDATPAIGILKEDYVYQEASGEAKEQKIPAGSLIFTGEYKGNPAYNVVVLYDEAGNIVGGIDSDGALTASQIVLAPDPGNAMLGDISDGAWIYWIEPSDIGELPSGVRAELYRVDDALTNEGQRLVSDTLFFDVPALEALPDIELKK